MLDRFKKETIEYIKQRYDSTFHIEEEDWGEVLNQVTNHLVFNHIFFLKDIRVEDYFDSIWRYVEINKSIPKK